jgi:hypothetical protein
MRLIAWSLTQILQTVCCFLQQEYDLIIPGVLRRVFFAFQTEHNVWQIECVCFLR